MKPNFVMEQRIVSARPAAVAPSVTSITLPGRPRKTLWAKRVGPYLDGLIPRWAAGCLAIVCGALLELLSPRGVAHTSLLSALIAFGGLGLLVAEILYARQTTAGVRAGFRALLAICPSPVVIVDQKGFIEFANEAANELLTPRSGDLTGEPVAAFLPDLDRALRSGEAPRLRAAMKCAGRRDRIGSFTAQIRLFVYEDGATEKFAAVIVEVAEEPKMQPAPCALRARAQSPGDRQTEVVQLVVEGFSNKEIAARLHTSERTVKSALQRLFTTWDVHTRAQLVRAVVENQFLSFPHSPGFHSSPLPRNPGGGKHRDSGVSGSGFTAPTFERIDKYVA